MQAKIEFQGYRDDKEWKHYAWRVTIGAESFEYCTGIGHATPFFTKGKMAMNKKPTDKQCVRCENSSAWVHIPSADTVLDCLFSDAECGSYSFNEFCSNLGYSSDSLNALNTYRDCMTTAERLRKALGAEYQAELNRIQTMRNEGNL